MCCRRGLSSSRLFFFLLRAAAFYSGVLFWSWFVSSRRARCLEPHGFCEVRQLTQQTPYSTKKTNMADRFGSEQSPPSPSVPSAAAAFAQRQQDASSSGPGVDGPPDTTNTLQKKRKWPIGLGLSNLPRRHQYQQRPQRSRNGSRMHRAVDPG